jgi:Icc-related predicted phosphoesterase
MKQLPILIHGDNHGQWDRLARLIDQKEIKDCILISVGDCGIGFVSYEKQMRQCIDLNNRFKKRGIQYYAIRGNHDDPAYFDGSVNLSNFKLLSDYHTEIFNNQKFLFVGGGISIDRLLRTLDHSYWINEAFVLDQSKIIDCDVLITHSAPYWNGPFGKEGISSWCMRDTSLWDDCKKERIEIAELIQKCGAKKHYCGHFHEYFWVDFKECYSRILAIDEIVEHQ